MGFKVDNAIIMAAGYASRFAPLSYECPKALLKIRGEILIERQIKQLQQAGIKEIVIVVGYKKEQFAYLTEKYGVTLVENPEYNTRNNHSTIYAVKDYLKNTYICSSDNYFTKNPFESEVDESYYAAVYGEGYTKEWCMDYDENDWITQVTIGGHDAWYMLGHAFWTEAYSNKFVSYLDLVYELPETKHKFWEEIYMDYIDELHMKIRRYESEIIYEFDSLDELRKFDDSYLNDSGSVIMKTIAENLNCKEGEIVDFLPMRDKSGEVKGFYFYVSDRKYRYLYNCGRLEEVTV